MEGNERLEWVFKAVEYLNQYRNNGIQFILVDDSKLEAIKNGEMLFEAPAPNKKIQDYTTARFCKERWIELEPRKTFEDFIDYELKFIDSIPDEVYNDFEFQLDLIKKYYKDWIKKEQGYFPTNDPFANWRKTKYKFEGFYSKYKLHQDNPKKINSYAKKLYQEEFFNYCRRAEVEFEKHIIYLTNEGKSYCNSIKQDLTRYEEQLHEMNSNKLFKGANMPQMTTTLNNLQPLWKLIDQFNKIFNTTSNKQKKNEIDIEPQEIFTNPKYKTPCLSILQDLDKAALNKNGEYIGKNKGVFPLWIRVLSNFTKKKLILPLSDIEYKQWINTNIPNANLSKDASEFRKEYRSLSKSNTKHELNVLLSQLNQSGKLGK